MKLFKKVNKDGHTDRRTKSQPVARKTFKDYALTAYVLLTVMGLYSAAMVYAGTQLAPSAHADNATVIKVASPK